MENTNLNDIINNFFEVAKLNRGKLFSIDNDVIITSFFNNYSIIKRSDEIENLFKQVVNSVKDNKSEGFIYFLHQENEGKIIPLYLGIARRIGNKGNISALFKNSFPRWEYYKNGNYHLSNLNAVVFKEGYTQDDFNKYEDPYLKWAKAIFTNEEFPITNDKKLKLRQTLYLSLIEWNNDKKSFVDVLGHTTIRCEESILINLLSKNYKTLLNKDI